NSGKMPLEPLRRRRLPHVITRRRVIVHISAASRINPLPKPNKMSLPDPATPHRTPKSVVAHAWNSSSFTLNITSRHVRCVNADGEDLEVLRRLRVVDR